MPDAEYGGGNSNSGYGSAADKDTKTSSSGGGGADAGANSSSGDKGAGVGGGSQGSQGSNGSGGMQGGPNAGGNAGGAQTGAGGQGSQTGGGLGQGGQNGGTQNASREGQGNVDGTPSRDDGSRDAVGANSPRGGLDSLNDTFGGNDLSGLLDNDYMDGLAGLTDAERDRRAKAMSRGFGAVSGIQPGMPAEARVQLSNTLSNAWNEKLGVHSTPNSTYEALRTLTGEAANQSLMGMAAAFNTMNNRLQIGQIDDRLDFGQADVMGMLAGYDANGLRYEATKNTNNVSGTPANPGYTNTDYDDDAYASSALAMAEALSPTSEFSTTMPDTVLNATHYLTPEAAKTTSWYNKDNFTPLGDHLFGNAEDISNKVASLRANENVQPASSTSVPSKTTLGGVIGPYAEKAFEKAKDIGLGTVNAVTSLFDAPVPKPQPKPSVQLGSVRADPSYFGDLKAPTQDFTSLEDEAELDRIASELGNRANQSYFGDFKAPTQDFTSPEQEAELDRIAGELNNRTNKSYYGDLKAPTQDFTSPEQEAELDRIAGVVNRTPANVVAQNYGFVGPAPTRSLEDMEPFSNITEKTRRENVAADYSADMGRYDTPIEHYSPPDYSSDMGRYATAPDYSADMGRYDTLDDPAGFDLRDPNDMAGLINGDPTRLGGTQVDNWADYAEQNARRANDLAAFSGMGMPNTNPASLADYDQPMPGAYDLSSLDQYDEASMLRDRDKAISEFNGDDLAPGWDSQYSPSEGRVNLGRYEDAVLDRPRALGVDKYNDPDSIQSYKDYTDTFAHPGEMTEAYDLSSLEQYDEAAMLENRDRAVAEMAGWSGLPEPGIPRPPTERPRSLKSKLLGAAWGNLPGMINPGVGAAVKLTGLPGMVMRDQDRFDNMTPEEQAEAMARANARDAARYAERSRGSHDSQGGYSGAGGEYDPTTTDGGEDDGTGAGGQYDVNYTPQTFQGYPTDYENYGYGSEHEFY